MHELLRKNDDPSEWLTLTQVCGRYFVSASTLEDWYRQRGFPAEAKRSRPGWGSIWHVPTVDDWLRSRPRHARQRPSRWWPVVGVEGYPDKKGRGTK